MRNSPLVIQLINEHIPVPPKARRARLWVLVGEQVRFPSGLCMAVEHLPAEAAGELRMAWHYRHDTRTTLTAYEPANLLADCGQRVVLRAVSLADGHPYAVLVEVESIAGRPDYVVEVAA